MAAGREDSTRGEEYAWARDSRHRCRHTNTNGHPGEGGRLHNPLCTWRSPPWGLHHTGSGGATRTPPHGRASRDEEERYSGYFSCFVTRTIMLCLPACSPTPREHRPLEIDAQHCAWA